VIDLYAGSCATLLAAGGLCPDVRTVGIERDNNWLVPFDKILEDFEIRDLPLPTLVRGDSRDHTIIEQILDEPYDVVLADPPYGKRGEIGRGAKDGRKAGLEQSNSKCNTKARAKQGQEQCAATLKEKNLLLVASLLAHTAHHYNKNPL